MDRQDHSPNAAAGAFGARTDRRLGTDELSDRRCAMLAASALFIFGGFLGCAVYRLLGIGESELYDNLIERYFVALFYKCSTPGDVFAVVSQCFIHELGLFVAVFLGGFTLFTAPISGLALLYRGLLFGFSLTMLQFSSMAGLLLDSMIYLAAEFAVSMLLVILAARAFVFFYPERRPILRSRSTGEYAALFLRVAMLVFANVCGMLFMIYVYI